MKDITVYLHIGMGKTGTSALQSFFAKIFVDKTCGSNQLTYNELKMLLKQKYITPVYYLLKHCLKPSFQQWEKKRHHQTI